MSVRGGLDPKLWLAAWLLIGPAILTSCGGPPQVGVNNYRLVAGLRTALSARRTDWLDAAAKSASEKHASSELNDEQFAAIEAIIAQARDGQWQEAEDAAIRLSEAQKAPADSPRPKPSRK